MNNKLNLKCISIVLVFMLTVSAKLAYAQQDANATNQTPERKASCEQQRLTCQKNWAQTNSFGVPVTPPDKTKLCTDVYYACMNADRAKQDKVGSRPKQRSGTITLDPTACSYSCELQRLTCQKNGAQINSFGVSVTPPEKTKQCWESFYPCVKRACGVEYPYKCKADEGSGCVPQ